MLKLKRRHFVTAAAGLGASLVCPSWRNSVGGGLHGRNPQNTFRRTSFALGTKVSITLLHADGHRAEAAFNAAFDAIEEVESQLSIYRADSQLSRLNRSGRLAAPHGDMLAVLSCACETSRRSAGAFDITVQPLWEIFESAQKSGRLPTSEEIAKARQRVDWRRVQVAQGSVRLLEAGTKVTLNGIAQGYAADRALAALRRCDVQHALIDTGELAALGDKGGQSRDSAWTVGLQHPRQPESYIALTRLKDRCLSTSGDYATTFSSDRRFHHVFDPVTGQSPSELASVSVAAPSAMQADAWSTALFVMGVERAIDVLRTLPDHDALFVLKDGRTLATPGFPLFDEGAAS